MKKKQLENVKLLKWIYFIVLLILVLFLFFNKYGIGKFIRLKAEINSIEQKIKQDERQIKKYDEDIKSLRNDDRKLEEVAREKFYMKKKNEKAFRFRDKKEKNNE